MTEPTKYPIHDDLKLRAGERMVVQRVINWIAEQGYEICEDINADRARRGNEYEPVRLHEDKLVAAIMGIDYKAFNAEKDALYDELLATTAKAPA